MELPRSLTTSSSAAYDGCHVHRASITLAVGVAVLLISVDGQRAIVCGIRHAVIVIIWVACIAKAVAIRVRAC
jgi:hypothetical protein